MAPAIEIKELTKDFPLGLGKYKLRAVDHLSLRVEQNQVFGLLGPNGSGKSTTMKVILGLLAPTAGECRVYGIPSHKTAARREVGFLPEAPYFYKYLSGLEMVVLMGKICGLSRARARERAWEVIEWVGLKDAARRRVGTYSKGMLQRIGIAQALVHDPKLIILDEPTAGVDPVGSAEISSLVLKLKEAGKTILLCSHLLAQVEDICDHVAIMNKGRCIRQGPLAEITQGQGDTEIRLDQLPEQDVEALRSWLGERGIDLRQVKRPQLRLDEVFLREIGKADLIYRQGSGSVQLGSQVTTDKAGKDSENE
ncbi:MAG: ABC transporter ATP-binding protein [Opitutales bacterium]|nr:ABC transporter ATP-binding protein [Opitutales bacterium]